MPGQRKQRADGERTREAIVREAVTLATVHGLERLSIGNLANALDMSKSGIYAHFGSKQDLQLATVDEAGRIFQDEFIEPALAAAPGLGQLVALCDAFFDHLERRTFPGGCFFAGAVLEMGARPGPVKEQIAAFQGGLTALIRQFAVTALERHELPTDEDPDALTFELNGIILAANTNFVLRQDPAALDLARNVVRRRLRIHESGRGHPTKRRKSRRSRSPHISPSDKSDCAGRGCHATRSRGRETAPQCRRRRPPARCEAMADLP
jgi:AcrR family transcriptional regulator